jgi:hypothetical protein
MADLSLCSWESKALHLEFRDTALFKENIGLLREKNGGAELVSLNPARGRIQNLNQPVVPRAFQSSIDLGWSIYRSRSRRKGYIN